MTNEEQQLLIRYLEYRKKRNKIIIIFILILLSGIGAVVIFVPSMLEVGNKDNENVQVEEKDTQAPVIVLKEKAISIIQNDIFDYKEHIESVIDNVDGDLTSNIEYNEIDTSNVGEFDVTYIVSDKAGNKATEVLSVTINVKSEPQNQENEPTTNNTSSTSNNTSSGTSSTQKNNGSSQPASTNINKTQTKDFLFIDGYDMNTITDAVNKYINDNGGRGEAYPIQDAEGIITGMRVKIY